MEILKGAAVAEALTKRLAEEVKTMTSPPVLATVRVGERPDDISYERGAKNRMAKIGIKVEPYVLPEDISQEKFLGIFDQLNEAEHIDGILLFRPLPKHLDEAAILSRIAQDKDVDGIGPENMAKIFAGETDGFAPCTAQAVIEILDHAGIDLTGKRVTVVGRSLVIGKPVAMLLIQKNATVTVCHTRTRDLAKTCQQAEVLIAAAGKANMIGAEEVGKDAVVIDVGINVNEEGKICGDVNFDEIKEIASAATPVPGGVGAVTTSVLAEHVVRAARLHGKSAK